MQALNEDDPSDPSGQSRLSYVVKIDPPDSRLVSVPEDDNTYARAEVCFPQLRESISPPCGGVTSAAAFRSKYRVTFSQRIFYSKKSNPLIRLEKKKRRFRHRKRCFPRRRRHFRSRKRCFRHRKRTSNCFVSLDLIIVPMHDGRFCYNL